MQVAGTGLAYVWVQCEGQPHQPKQRETNNMATPKAPVFDAQTYLAQPAPVPVTGDAEAEVVDVHVTDASTRLAEAIKLVGKVEKEGSAVYGNAVMATVYAMEAGLTRQQIANIITENTERVRKVVKVVTDSGATPIVRQSKGSAARYIMLARYERGEWLEGETPITTVEIEGNIYSKPVEALMAKVASFTKVWQAFRDAVRPATQDFTKVPTDPVEAIERAVVNLGFRVKGKDEQGKETFITMPITKPLAFVAAMHGLMKTETAKTLLPAKQRAAFLTMLDQGVNAIPAQAKTLVVLKGGKTGTTQAA